MKLEYRDLSSSSAKRSRPRQDSALGFLDVLACSLFIFVVAAYFVLPKQIERGVDYVVFDPASNSYTSFRCLRERTTRNVFTLSRDVLELKSSVRVVHHSELERLGKPQPDGACYAARGFVDTVSRWDYFFGWLSKAVR